MKNNKIKKISKYLSLLLRHQPEKIGLSLDNNGWASVAEILNHPEINFIMVDLEEVVATNDKKRFSFNEDKTKIRANQGHSIKGIDLELEVKTPPAFLYHGTVAKFLSAIKKEGLQKMNRQHVHLSADRETAVKVGSRRGKPIILSIQSGAMHKEGYAFYLSANDVWLTDEVPSKFIVFK